MSGAQTSTPAPRGGAAGWRSSSPPCRRRRTGPGHRLDRPNARHGLNVFDSLALTRDDAARPGHPGWMGKWTRPVAVCLSEAATAQRYVETRRALAIVGEIVSQMLAA